MALEIQNLSIRYRDTLLLEDIRFSAPATGITALLGPSGCGKSSVLRWLAGILPHDLQARGSAWLNGRPVSPPDYAIGYQPQSDALFPWLTLAQNAALGLQISGLSKSAALKKARSCFAEFGLDGAENLFPDQVSGGMRQRAAFLRSMLRQTEVVLLDEPFSALDAVTRLHMQNWLQAQLSARPKCVILVTHDLNEASSLADKILVMGTKPGRMIAEINPQIPPELRTAGNMAPLRETLKSLLLKDEIQ